MKVKVAYSARTNPMETGTCSGTSMSRGTARVV